jgi:hypothetical protein
MRIRDPDSAFRIPGPDPGTFFKIKQQKIENLGFFLSFSGIFFVFAKKDQITDTKFHLFGILQNRFKKY